ncbi:putative 26S proteasome regulatory subunit [Apiotrichum porosum]|uniref:Probable 26S proteasome regulatory subunit p27 n=1 Tax=Apiotrichum porosum TaxID=105984 RepID=A0A427Y754_9TREE|nr:putative 26S proteasome regulatory subunit [Apiotrichum porosum]RSH86894.1 putative 26S proteasome regulatory subunit [Apiotrichum porosum]
MAFPAPHETVQLPLPDPEAYPGEPREYARALMQRKDEIEGEIDALKEVLTSHGASTDTSLVDPEGYPRGDIDVYAIRHARSALARLYNDRTEVTRRLATALEAAFSSPDDSSSFQAPSAQAAAQTPPSSASSTSRPAVNGHHDSSLNLPDTWPDRAVARVNSVAPSSPAAAAGLEASDLIYSFSGITASNANAMQAIGSTVAASEGQPLTLLVTRASERKMLRLTPRSGWGGRGLLGCHILPV